MCLKDHRARCYTRMMIKQYLTIHAMKMSTTPGGGTLMVLHCPSCDLSNVSKALIAASTVGSALARSVSASDCFLDTSF